MGARTVVAEAGEMVSWGQRRRPLLDRLSPVVSLTLVAPGSLSSPKPFSYSQVPTSISHHRPYFLSALPSLTNEFLPSSHLLSAVIEKVEFDFPRDNR